MPPTPAPSRDHSSPFLVCLAAWAIPGSGHLLLKRRKGLVFLVALLLMFAIGVGLEGRLFGVDPADPFAVLWAIGDVGNGAAYFAARLLGFGGGRTTALTYEYGNLFIVAAGVLNMLVVLDAFDIASGRK